MSAVRPPEVPDPTAPVDDEVLVYRLIPTSACDVVDGLWEFQSSAFDNATPEPATEPQGDMSVVLGDTLAALRRSPDNLPTETTWAGDQWGVARLSVMFLRHDEDQRLLRTPTDEERAHGDVRGSKGYKRRRRIKKHATWVVRPVAIPEDAEAPRPEQRN